MTTAILRIAPSLTLTILTSVLTATVATAENIFVDRFDDSATATACAAFTVNDCSLRGAIIRANGSSEDDTVWIPIRGTYRLTLVGPGNDAGDLDITHNLTIKGWDRSTVIIDASGIPGGGRVFEVHPGVTATISGVWIYGGDGPPIVGSGAGIWNSGTLTLEQIYLSSNTATVHGGGIFNATGAWLQIEQSLIFNNDAGHSGGGIFNGGTLVITDSTVSGNDAAEDGGGVYIDGGTTILNRAVCRHNSAESFGGCAYNKGTLNTTNSTFSHNHAPNGFGGAILNEGDLDLINVTIVDNDSLQNQGSAIFNLGVVPIDTVNTILSGTCGGDPSLFTSWGGNIESPGHTCPLNPATDLFDIADLMLDWAGHNGGIVTSFPLLPGSPAIDAGNNLLCTSTDQRRQPRPIDGDGDLDPVCDSGSTEYNPAEIFLDGFEDGTTEAWPTRVGTVP